MKNGVKIVFVGPMDNSITIRLRLLLEYAGHQVISLLGWGFTAEQLKKAISEEKPALLIWLGLNQIQATMLTWQLWAERIPSVQCYMAYPLADSTTATGYVNMFMKTILQKLKKIQAPQPQ